MSEDLIEFWSGEAENAKSELTAFKKSHAAEIEKLKALVNAKERHVVYLDQVLKKSQPEYGVYCRGLFMEQVGLKKEAEAALAEKEKEIGKLRGQFAEKAGLT